MKFVTLLVSGGVRILVQAWYLRNPKCYTCRFFSEKIAARFRPTIHNVTDNSLHLCLQL